MKLHAGVILDKGKGSFTVKAGIFILNMVRNLSDWSIPGFMEEVGLIFYKGSCNLLFAKG